MAKDNNLSETAFFIPDNDDYKLRWFTPCYGVLFCKVLQNRVAILGCAVRYFDG
ncbi:PhzF family phenazine biosynthesis protein [Hyella patelloides]|uniref:PhzF family phenazine biosynthesis protein n=1 Tax=Hyella patelloides TaxID=1982969 RepID=UPI001C952FAE